MKRATLIVLLLAALVVGAPSSASDRDIQLLAEDLGNTQASLENDLYAPVEPLMDLPKYDAFVYDSFVNSDRPASEEEKGTLVNLMSGAAKLAKTPINLMASSKEAVEKFFQFGSSEEKTSVEHSQNVTATESTPFALAPTLEIRSVAAGMSFFDKEEARLMAAHRTAEQATRQAKKIEDKEPSGFGAPVIKMFILLENFGHSEK